MNKESHNSSVVEITPCNPDPYPPSNFNPYTVTYSNFNFVTKEEFKKLENKFLALKKRVLKLERSVKNEK